mgnify:FL=1
MSSVVINILLMIVLSMDTWITVVTGQVVPVHTIIVEEIPNPVNAMRVRSFVVVVFRYYCLLNVVLIRDNKQKLIDRIFFFMIYFSSSAFSRFQILKDA